MLKTFILPYLTVNHWRKYNLLSYLYALIIENLRKRYRQQNIPDQVKITFCENIIIDKKGNLEFSYQ